MSLAEGGADWAGVAKRRAAKGRNTTIEDAGHRGVPYPEIRCPDRLLANAEVVSLGLSPHPPGTRPTYSIMAEIRRSSTKGFISSSN